MLFTRNVQNEISHHDSINPLDPLNKRLFMKSKWALNHKVFRGSTAKQSLQYLTKHQNKPHKDENQSHCK